MDSGMIYRLGKDSFFDVGLSPTVGRFGDSKKAVKGTRDLDLSPQPKCFISFFCLSLKESLLFVSL
jgi:hypothetical protein